MKQNETNKTPKNAIEFFCEKCNFICFKKSEWDRHLSTRKHKMKQNETKKTPKNALPEKVYVCDYCEQEFKSRTTFWRHKKQCATMHSHMDEEDDISFATAYVPPLSNSVVTQPSSGISNEQTLELVTTLVRQNQETTQKLAGTIEKLVDSGVGNSMTNSTINNNSHNKTFNLNFFLNETCKDAMNITDFVNSLALNLQDVEKVGELGYAEGISRMFLNGLSQLDVEKRPIHCSDLKREVLHIKDKDKWERDTENQDKLKKAIKDLSTKNIMLLDDWQRENPGCKEYNNTKNDIYLKMMVESLGPADDVAERKDFAKIIKKIARRTIINRGPV